MSQPPIAYPAFLDLRNRLALVVGEGPLAERKARGLLKYGADVVVIGPHPTPALIDAEADGLLTLERRAYERDDPAGAFLVICTDPDESVRHQVFSDADGHGCFVSVPEAPELSSFSSPSVVRRGALQIAISTAGRAPELAKHVRAGLKEEFGEEWDEYVKLTAELRESLAERFTADERRTVLEAVAASDLSQRIRDGNVPDVESLIAEFAPAKEAPEEEVADEAESDVETDAGAGTEANAGTESDAETNAGRVEGEGT